MIKYLLIITVAAITVFSSCVKEKTVEPLVVEAGPCADTVSFSGFILPEIIDASCNTMGCHDQSGAAGYSLLNHNQVSTNANVIFSVINHDAGYTPMPYNENKIPDSLIQKFDCWMQQGLLNN
jgi:hypothetical protein